jgi:hypothetical protein
VLTAEQRHRPAELAGHIGRRLVAGLLGQRRVADEVGEHEGGRRVAGHPQAAPRQAQMTAARDERRGHAARERIDPDGLECEHALSASPVRDGSSE